MSATRKPLVAVVLGKMFTFKYIEPKLADISLDAQNTRFGHNIVVPTQDEIASRLDKEEETLPLANSIRANGGLINPIIVSTTEKAKQRTVKNGNRRTRAFQRLRKLALIDDPKTTLWSIIPAYERPAEMDDYHFDAYLAQEHGDAGTRQHNSYAKASYAYKMHKTHLMGEDDVIKLVAVHSGSALKNMMLAIEVSNNYPVIKDKAGEFRRPDQVYALYHEMIRKPGGKSKTAYKLMQRSINAGAVWTSKQSKIVAAIAKNPTVRSKFEEALRVEPARSVEYATTLLQREEPVALDGVWGASGRLISQIKKAPRADLEHLDDPKSEQTKTYKRLFSALLGLATEHEHLLGYLSDTVTNQIGASDAEADIG